MSLSLISSSFAGATELWKFGTQERTSRLTPLALWIRLQADAGGVRFFTLRKQGTQVGYSVTGGKTLVLTRFLGSSDSAGFRFSLGYSDSDRGIQNAADGANAVNLDSVGADGSGFLVFPSASSIVSFDVYYEITAGKFPRLVTDAGAQLAWLLYLGVEV